MWVKLRANALEISMLILLSACVSFLALYHLEDYPKIGSWDEGFLLQFPKNLVLYEKFAVRDVEKFSLFDYGLPNTGLTVLLPIALVFRIFAVGLLQARLVIGGYLLLAAFAIYLLVRQMYGWRAAIIATLFFLVPSGHWTNTVWWGRQVYGEVPALAFLALGTYLWFKAVETRQMRFSFSAGVMLGLVTMTKPQLVWIILPSVVVLWILDKIYFHGNLSLYHFGVSILLTGVFFALGIGYPVIFLGVRNFIGYVSTQGGQARIATWAFSPLLWYDNFRFLYTNGYLFWGMPSLVYALALCVKKRDISTGHLFLPLFVIIGLAWYVLASIGWERYALPFMAMTSVPAAKFFDDLIGKVSFHLGKQMRQPLGESVPSLAKGMAVFSMLVVAIAIPLASTAVRVLSAHDRSPHEFAQYINEHVPQDALIESWQWEIDFLTNRTYHHPSQETLRVLQNHIYLGGPYPTYDVQVQEVNYVIDGPYSKLVGIYSSFVQEHGTLLTSIGEYDLYKIEKTMPERS